MLGPEDPDHNPEDDDSFQEAWSEPDAGQFLFGRALKFGAGALPPDATYPIGDVRKALWRTMQSCMAGPKSSTPAEILPGVNDYALQLMRHLDRLDEIGRATVKVNDLIGKSMSAHIQTRQDFDDDKFVPDDIEPAILLSPGTSAIELGAAHVAVNACLVDALITPLPDKLPRDNLGE